MVELHALSTIIRTYPMQVAGSTLSPSLRLPLPAPVGGLLMQRDVGNLRGGHGRRIPGQPCSLCLRDKRRRESLHVSP